MDEKLSARSIAKVYDRKTPNPRSAEYLIWYYLKKYGIPMRDRVEGLAKDTAVAVNEWVAKYPPGGEGGQHTVVIPGGVGGSVKTSISLSYEEMASLSWCGLRDSASGTSIRRRERESAT